MNWRGVIEHYREFLPVSERTPVITLNEGNTPLIKADRLRDLIDKRIELYLKYEGANPTGSFKDRGMTLAISKAAEEGAQAVICASTGNTAASAAAYAARAGMRAWVLIPEGKVALGKLSQALIHGAGVLEVKGNFDDALAIVKEISQCYPIVLVNSLNPFRIEGQKSGAFEVCDQLGKRAPESHFIPVGNAGTIKAYWQGYREYKEAGRIDSLPRMMGWQAEGAAPIVRGHVIENPETIASAIRIGNPASWDAAVAAARESRGQIDMVSDEEIMEAYRHLAEIEGIFCEPASAAPVAGIIKYSRTKGFDKGDTVVCILTGHGLKDPDRVLHISREPLSLPAEMGAVRKVMGL
ncbi:MAG: threonine synthase [candidate division NC10 bacterium]|nr:threonine synthase [candidate division NC10 bacterium]